MRSIEQLIGATLSSITGLEENSEAATFTLATGEKFLMHHSQDCCESVSIDDIDGDILDLIGTPIVSASEEESNENPENHKPEWQDSFTWTFYKIATIKGGVTIRWYGESNGYYSESVDFKKMGEI